MPIEQHTRLTPEAARRVVVLGSTGSVGQNTLSVLRQHPGAFRVVGLAAGRFTPDLCAQIKEFSPLAVSVSSEEVASLLRAEFAHLTVHVGEQGHADMVRDVSGDVLISAMMGVFGLHATLAAVEENYSVVGIANKEILVMAGGLIRERLKRSKTVLVPVDSEHSAIFQALMGNDHSFVESIWLTASGGPFRTRSADSFSRITLEEALKHPNWSMGRKITVDSATMMNKGLEYIEAIRLFDCRPDQVKVLVHPQSIVHSLVEYVDGSWMAQLGISDMKIPISLALAYPKRLPLELSSRLDLAKIATLTFESPDFEKFPCLRLAMSSVEVGDQGPIILNAANEVAVDRFLANRLDFMGISKVVEEALGRFSTHKASGLDDILALNDEVATWAKTA